MGSSDIPLRADLSGEQRRGDAERQGVHLVLRSLQNAPTQVQPGTGALMGIIELGNGKHVTDLSHVFHDTRRILRFQGYHGEEKSAMKTETSIFQSSRSNRREGSAETTYPTYNHYETSIQRAWA